MKKLIALLTLTLSLSTLATEVNIHQSRLKWTGEKVVGGGHYGQVAIKSADLKFDGNNLKSGTIVMDMKSISTMDLSGEWKQKLDGHLKNDDFFGVDKYPTSKLVITSVENKGSVYKVKGNLTIKDKTNQVEFDAKKENKSLVGKINFDRTKFNIRYGSPSFFNDLGDKAIANTVKLDFTLKLK